MIEHYGPSCLPVVCSGWARQRSDTQQKNNTECKRCWKISQDFFTVKCFDLWPPQWEAGKWMNFPKHNQSILNLTKSFPKKSQVWATWCLIILSAKSLGSCNLSRTTSLWFHFTAICNESNSRSHLPKFQAFEKEWTWLKNILLMTLAVISSSIHHHVCQKSCFLLCSSPGTKTRLSEMSLPHGRISQNRNVRESWLNSCRCTWPSFSGPATLKLFCHALSRLRPPSAQFSLRVSLVTRLVFRIEETNFWPDQSVISGSG